MKTKVKRVRSGDVEYTALMFVCPGCVAGGPEGYEGVHMLPVNNKHDIDKPNWDWDGNEEEPTLSPSILTSMGDRRCHSFLKKGVFQFLSDCTHPLAGQSVPIPDLPEWAANG